ncbi:MAG: chemotaxis protein CheW [Bdellovibrionota bacterium]
MNYQELLVFELAGCEFAVPLALVEEVIPASPVTPIPNSPKFLLGLAAVRGRAMGVIDAAKRYGLGPTFNAYFMVCQVRGNSTAVAIDRPVVAGAVPIRALSSEQTAILIARTKIDQKFVSGGFELFEVGQEGTEPTSTGVHFLSVDADLFVSNEMASRLGEN